MASCDFSVTRRYFIPIILAAVISRVLAETTTVPMEMETMSEMEPDTTESVITTTYPTPTRTDTTSSYNTTRDILHSIHQLISLQKEADSLRVAVIILGIISALAIIAVLIGVGWVIIKRRQSKRMGYSKNQELSNNPTNNTLNSKQLRVKKKSKPQTVSTGDSKTSTDPQHVTKQDEPTTIKSPKSKTDLNAGTIKHQEPGDTKPSATTGRGLPVDSVYQPIDVQPKSPKVVTKNDTVHYANDTADMIDDDDVYEEIAERGAKQANTETSGKSSSSNVPSENPEEIYENCGDIEAATGSYSALQSETQYSHYYK